MQQSTEKDVAAEQPRKIGKATRTIGPKAETTTTAQYCRPDIGVRWFNFKITPENIRKDSKSSKRRKACPRLRYVGHAMAEVQVIICISF